MKNKEKEKETGYKEIVTNKKARFDFELLEFLEVGIVLTGSEVKSLREKKANLTDAFAQVKNGELILQNFHITPYKNGGYANHTEVRPRKLLAHKKEIVRLEKQIKEKGLALVGVKIYFKRESLQKKEAKIEIDRAMKQRNRS